MKNRDRILTSVKLDPTLWVSFKTKCAEDGFSFQKLATRAIYLYLTDMEFRKTIMNQLNTQLNN